MNRRTVAAFGLLIVAGALLGGCEARREAPRAGGPIEFVLDSLGGPRVSSADWRGRTVVLNVWASWCAPCRQEMASLEALSRALDPARAIVVGITVDDDLNLAREYLLREGISFPNLLAASSGVVVRERLQVTSLPATLVLSPDGTLRTRFVGPRNWTDPDVLVQLGLGPLRPDPGDGRPPQPGISPAQLPAT